MEILVIGDVHGKVDQLIDIIQNSNADEIIQLGDLGFYRSWTYLQEYCIQNNEYRLTIVPGNHDYYEGYKKDPFKWSQSFNPIHVADCTNNSTYFTVRGADSIDKHLRTEGVDWWPEEELSYSVLGTIIEQFEGSKPKIVFSHDCPQSVMEQLFHYKEKSRTRQALNQMFELHQPEYHFFGHHHKAIDEVINGTRFICLPELATFELEIL